MYKQVAACVNPNFTYIRNKQAVDADTSHKVNWATAGAAGAPSKPKTLVTTWADLRKK